MVQNFEGDPQDKKDDESSQEKLQQQEDHQRQFVAVLHGKCLLDWSQHRETLITLILSESLELLKQLSKYEISLREQMDSKAIRKNLKKAEVKAEESRYIDSVQVEERFTEIKQMCMASLAPLGTRHEREKEQRIYLGQLVEMIHSKSALLIKLGNSDPIIAMVADDAIELFHMFQVAT